MINFEEFITLATEKNSPYSKWTENQFNRWVERHGTMTVSTAKGLFKYNGDCSTCEETKFGCVLKQKNNSCEWIKEKENGFKRKNCNDSGNQS